MTLFQTKNKEATFYDVLDIDEAVKPSDSDIKAAYYKKIRQYPPEKFPEDAKKINAAYEALATETKRKMYFLQLRQNAAYAKHGKDIEKWITKIAEYTKEENWTKVLTYSNKVIKVHPENELARLAAYSCYKQKDDYKKAIEQLTYLEDVAVEDLNRKAAIGFSFLHYYDQSRKKKFLTEAERYFQSVVVQNPKNLDAWGGLAEIETRRGNFSNVLIYLENAICSRDTMDDSVLHVIIKKLLVYIKTQNIDKLKLEFERARTMLTGEEVGEKLVNELVDNGIEAAEINDIVTAEILLEMAISLTDSKDTHQIYKNIQRTRIRKEQLQLLQEDSSIVKPLKELVLLLLVSDALSKMQRELSFSTCIDAIFAMINSGQGAQVRSSINRLSIVYPVLFEIESYIYQDIAKYMGFRILPSTFTIPQIVNFREKWSCGHKRFPWQQECGECQKGNVEVLRRSKARKKKKKNKR
jgi:curved DNA-binding protein CbpA